MMALSSWDLLDLAGTPRNPGGELRLIRELLDREKPAAEPAAVQKAVPASRPALARVA